MPMAGHCGEITTRMDVGKRFYWPKIKHDVEHFVCIYVKCQSTKSIYLGRRKRMRGLFIIEH